MIKRIINISLLSLTLLLTYSCGGDDTPEETTETPQKTPEQLKAEEEAQKKAEEEAKKKAEEKAIEEAKEEAERLEALKSPILKNPEDWTKIEALSDEFDNSEIDETKWKYDVPNFTNATWSWDKENVTAEGGNLNLSMKYKKHKPTSGNFKKFSPDTEFFYTSGIIESKIKRTYGYYEAKIKGVSVFPGASPAFWVFGNQNHKTVNVKGKDVKILYSEIDFVELQQGENTRQHPQSVRNIDMNLHSQVEEGEDKIWRRPGSHPDVAKNLIVSEWDPRDDFHIYGCHVTKETITWYIDNIKVAEKPNLYWHLDMKVILSLGLRTPHVLWGENNCGKFSNGDVIVRCPVPSKATETGFPTTMQVDWVRVHESKTENNN